MADDKTPPAEADREAEGAGGEVTQNAANDPETVDAEIVETPRGEVVDEDGAVVRDGVVTSGPLGDDTLVAEETASAPPPAKKKGVGLGGGLVLAVVLIGAAAAVGYVLTSDGEDVLRRDAANDSGVVVSEAAPRRPLANEPDPVGAEAPAARPAARQAAAAELAAAREVEAAPDAEETSAPTPTSETGDPQAGIASLMASRGEQSPMEAMPAEAAAAEPAEAEGDATEVVATPTESADQEAQAEATDESSPMSSVPEQDEEAASEPEAEASPLGTMAARIAAARAAQRPQGAATTEEPAPAPSEPETDASEPVTAEAQPPAPAEDAREAGDGSDPNALSRFTRPRQSTTSPFAAPGEADEEDDAEAQAEATLEPAAPPARSAARPTGRVTPPATATQADDEEDAAPQRIQPRGAVVTPPAERAPLTTSDLPDGVATDEEVEARLSEVREGLRRLENEASPSGEELDQRFTAVRQEVRESVLAEAEQRIASAIRETETEVAELRDQLTQQEQRSDQRIAQLRDRLEVLQRRDVGASQQGVLILALSNLSGVIKEGRPFERQLADVQRLAPNAESLSEARPYAAEGLPTDRELRQSFREATRRASAAEARAGADGPLDRFVANIRGLFSVRPAGATEGDTTSAVISRAEAALEAGNLDGAVNEVEALDGEALAAFEPWLEEARAKAQVRTRIDRLERAILAQDG